MNLFKSIKYGKKYRKLLDSMDIYYSKYLDLNTIIDASNMGLLTISKLDTLSRYHELSTKFIDFMVENLYFNIDLLFHNPDINYDVTDKLLKNKKYSSRILDKLYINPSAVYYTNIVKHWDEILHRMDSNLRYRDSIIDHIVNNDDDRFLIILFETYETPLTMEYMGKIINDMDKVLDDNKEHLDEYPYYIIMRNYKFLEKKFTEYTSPIISIATDIIKSDISSIMETLNTIEEDDSSSNKVLDAMVYLTVKVVEEYEKQCKEQLKDNK